MAWGKPRVQPVAASGAKPKPFQRVERRIATVPIKEAFRTVRAKEAGAGIARANAMNRSFNASGDAARASRDRAVNALAAAEKEAAKHFGGDVGKMQTHLKRWLKWGKGDLMSPAAAAEGVAGAAAKAAVHERFKREAREQDKLTKGGMKRVKTKA